MLNINEQGVIADLRILRNHLNTVNIIYNLSKIIINDYDKIKVTKNYCM